MKNRLLSLLLLALALLPLAASADSFVNLTPRPKSMTVQDGTLTLPQTFVINCAGLSDVMTAETTRFAAAFNAATGYTATVAESGDASALFQVKESASALAEGGYKLTVKADGVTIEASGELGLYYAFQTVKKILPANVMAGVKDEKVTAYTLPCLVIDDEPRYGYRGFMLDVARHFFTVQEVERMLDVMAYYKMNRFHWHLTDDQGWRAEIKKYPKLTSVGATAPNSRFTSMTDGAYWINRPYGPYFYTQDEMREVVAYAKERHIEIIPEVDMPGHFCAALAAYPEFSCTPDASHTVMTDGGIYSDVLNVANPAAVQFTKDVLEELMDIFPGEYIHIGGDECPVTAWKSNADCQAQYNELGLTDYRQLQSHFIKEMADFVKSKGRKLAVWNEGITASGADLDIMKETGAMVYCWTSPRAAAQKAQQLGMSNIYTPWGPYYINRKQSANADEPVGAGDGTDDVKKTYAEVPPTETDAGVQGTFWTEFVNDREYMEYLALPRLIAVAEAGWTPQARKDFSDFQQRMSADTVLLNYGGYRYCKYYMNETVVMPKVSAEGESHWYRLVSGATVAPRKGRCVELLSASSPLIASYANYKAAEGLIWTNEQAAEGADNYDYQWWRLEENAEKPGHYALVCKAFPDGSLSPQPTANSTSGRWQYDKTAKHYSFVLGDKAYGTVGNNRYYSIASDELSGRWLNSAMAGQGLSVNVYTSPTDGGGGQWEFQPMEAEPTPPAPTFSPLQEGHTYTFTNAVDGFDGTALTDAGKATNAQHSTDVFANNAWTVETAGDVADGAQTLTLKNAATGRAFASKGDFASRAACTVTMGSKSAELTLKYVSDNNTFRLQIGGKSLFPLPATTYPGTVNAGSTFNADQDAPAMQGAEWNVTEVDVVTFVCADSEGNALGTYTRSLPVGTEVTADHCPEFKNLAVETLSNTEEHTYSVTYKRSAYSVTYDCRDSHGALVGTKEESVAVGAECTVQLPAFKYFTLESASKEDGEKFTPAADTEISVSYTTDALSGVRELGEEVEKLTAGRSYVLYDAVTGANASRAGYRRVNASSHAVVKSNTIEGADPTHVWTLEASGTGSRFKVKNEYTALYVPKLVKSTATTASTSGDTFTFTRNADGSGWTVKGTNGLFWDGLDSGDLVGWDKNNGHPIRVYEYYVRPYFLVTVNCVDTEGNPLTSKEEAAPAGEAYTLIAPTVKGYSLSDVSYSPAFSGTLETHLTVTATYKKETDGIGSVSADAKGAGRSGIYDLSGRRLERVTRPGLYIVDGKKMLIAR